MRPENTELRMPRLGLGRAKTEETKPSLKVEVRDVDRMDRPAGQLFAADDKKADPRAQLTDVLGKIADTVPLYPNAGERLGGGMGGRFREIEFDASAVYNTTVVQGFRGPMVEPRVNPAILEGTAKVEGATTLGAVTKYENAYRLWADSPHHAMWASPFGQAFAAYALHRYGLGDEAGITRGKIGHAAAVTFHSRTIHAQQQAEYEAAGNSGPLVDPAWLPRLDLAGIAHDVGYMHGPLMHPGRGAQDLLSNFGKYVTNTGLLPSHDPKTQVEVEKVAVLAAMHGGRFPWDGLDKRLASSDYIMADLAEKLVSDSGLGDKLKGIIRSEYADYLAEPTPAGAPEKLGWLDDPKELKSLIRAGFILHCADNFNGMGPGKGTYDSIEAKAKQGALTGTVGNNMPIRTEAELDDFLRAQELQSLVGGNVNAASRFADDATELKKGLLEGAIDLSSPEALEKSLNAFGTNRALETKGTPKVPDWAPALGTLSNALKAYVRGVEAGFAPDIRSGDGYANMKNADVQKSIEGKLATLETALAGPLAKIPAEVAEIVVPGIEALVEGGRASLAQLAYVPELAR